MNLSYKYRLYPNDTQKSTIDRLMFEYNQAYNISLNLIQSVGKEMYQSGTSSNKIFNEIYLRTRSSLKSRGIRDMSALTQDAVRHVYNSLFTNIKKGKPFKLHFRNSSSLEGYIPVRNTYKLNNSRITIFNKMSIKVKMHRELPGDHKILGYRIIRESDEYYLVINMKIPDTEFKPKELIGIDSNQGNYTLSTGYEINFIKSIYPDLESKRLNAQKRLSSKKKGSKNRLKARKQLFKISRKIKRRRTHEIHQRANEVLKISNFIAVEKLDLKKMTSKTVKNKSMRKNMLHISHGQFFNVLDYKSTLLNGLVLRVNPEYTSMTCSRCGSIKHDLTLGDREYNCSHCGLSIKRDLNAAINIQRLGTSLYSSKNFKPRA